MLTLKIVIWQDLLGCLLFGFKITVFPFLLKTFFDGMLEGL